MFFCCRGGWRRAVCILDNLLHAGRIRSRRVCDLHDRLIAGE